jgi:YVTN family beta-propeller protein
VFARTSTVVVLFAAACSQTPASTDTDTSMGGSFAAPGALPPGGAGGASPPGAGGASGSVASPPPTANGGSGGAEGAMAAGTSGAGGAAPGVAGMNGGAGTTAADGLRDVLLVGNGVAATVSFLDATTFENLGSVNVLPDRDEVMGLISADIVRSIAYPAVKNAQLLHHFEPGGGDRFLDDVFVSPEGTVLYVSRSNLGDVAAFDLTKPDHPRLWRTFVEGVKADHATISHDGSRLVVSATTATVANVFDAKTGELIDSFPTGDFPHQNDYSADGKHIYNSSIGNVGYQAVSYQNNAAKGNRRLVKVDAATLQVVKTWDFDWGIRPSVITADETVMYANLSYLNGVIKYDLVGSVEIARNEQPLSAFAMETYATYDEYPHDSAHHGLAMSGDGLRLCDCGTIDNTVAIVTTADMQTEKMIDVGMVPYWATTSPDGKTCFVSLSGSDAVSVIDYASGTEVTTVPVGKFPQRSRLGRVPANVVAMLLPQQG